MAPNALQVHVTHNKATHDSEIELPVGIVRIHLIEALQLQAADLYGSSNPFVEFKFGGQTFSSTVSENTLEPVWNQFFQITITHRSERSLLEISVYDQDKKSKQLLGEGHVEIWKIEINGVLEEFLALKRVKTGVLHLRFDWRSLSSQHEDFVVQLEICAKIKERSSCILPAALCYVVIGSKSPLHPRMNTETTLSVKASVRLGDQVQVSEAYNFLKGPAWRETFCLSVFDVTDNEIIVDILDGKEQVVRLGSTRVMISDVVKERNMSISTVFSSTQSNPLAIVTLRVALRTFRADQDVFVIQRDVSVQGVVNEPVTGKNS